MKVATAQMAKHRIVIPKAVREALSIQPRDELLFLVDGGTAFLRPRPCGFTKVWRGLHEAIWPGPDTWLEEENTMWG